MKIKRMFTKKKIWIPLLIVLAALAISLFFLLRNKNFQSPDEGRAAFYEYPTDAIDSILNNYKIEEKIKHLFYFSSQNDSLADLLNLSTSYSGYFYLDFDSLNILETYKNNKLNTPFVRAIDEDLLPHFSGDSSFFVSPNLLNTINDSLILSRYYKHQTRLLIENKVNALIINLNLPEKIDSASVELISKKMEIKLEVLHRNNILSFIAIKKLPNSAEINNFKSILSNIYNAGLCGILVFESEALNIVKDTDFDGLVIYNIDGNDLPDENIITKTDAFLLSENNLNLKDQIESLIKKHSKKEDIFMKTSKVLRSAFWSFYETGEKDSVCSDLNLKLMESNITEASITLLKNDGNILPILDINQRFHILVVGNSKADEFINIAANYTHNYTISYIDILSDKKPTIPTNVNTLIIVYESGITDSIPTGLTTAINEFSKNKIFVNIGLLNSKILSVSANSILQVYNYDATGLSFAAQAIFGGIAVSGTLATWLNDTISYGYGLKTEKTRLKYSIPEDAGLKSDKLMEIDSIVQAAINVGAMHGCQVFIAKNGIVVYNKCFGYHDYSRHNQVKFSDMYDVASLTKICATTLAMMKMVETGQVKLDDKLEKYFKNTEINYGNIKADTIIFIDTVSIANKTKLEIKELVHNKDTIHLNDTLVKRTEIVHTRVTPSSNIFQVPVRALLVHQSGINPSLPILRYMFYQDSFKEYMEELLSGQDSLSTDTISEALEISYTRQEAFDYYYSNKKIKDSAIVQIAENMFLNKRWQDSLYMDVKRLGTFSRNIYQYTDMNMILAQMIIDSVNKKPIDRFVKEQFYQDLGMRNSSYTPREFNVPLHRIPPTENERFWRRQLIHGHVHDPSAAMLGGMSGNAGLFSCASDLGILGQMWLNGGTYGGKRYLNASTIKMFAATQPENHRGLGFDKAAIKNLNAPSAPSSTYGHTGFTGCVMWMDPENEIVYVFISNRLHPDVKNWRILGQNVLRNVHQVVYDAMGE